MVFTSYCSRMYVCKPVMCVCVWVCVCVCVCVCVWFRVAKECVVWYMWSREECILFFVWWNTDTIRWVRKKVYYILTIYTVQTCWKELQYSFIFLLFFFFFFFFFSSYPNWVHLKYFANVVEEENYDTFFSILIWNHHQHCTEEITCRITIFFFLSLLLLIHRQIIGITLARKHSIIS